MALTHFKFNLVPKAAVLTLHGSIPKMLAHYGECEGIELPSEEFANYWKGYPIKDFELEVGNLFPIVDSWGDISIYDSNESSKIEIDDEDILIKFDVVSADYDFLKSMFNLALEYECLFVICETSTLISTTNYDEFLGYLHASRAYRYVQNPERTLNEIKKKNATNKGDAFILKPSRRG